MSHEGVEVARRWWAGFNDHGLPTLAVCDEEIEIGNVKHRGPPSGRSETERWFRSRAMAPGLRH